MSSTAQHEEFELQTVAAPAELDEKPGACEVRTATAAAANGGETTAPETMNAMRPARPALAGLGQGAIRERRFKLRQRIELGLLGVVIVVVWILLALPIIFYHIPVNLEDEGNMTAPNDTNPNSNSTACLRGSATLYTGECVCELAGLQSCLTTNYSDVFVMEGLDFSELDVMVREVKAGLKFLGASPECEKAAISFYCFYRFKLCDESGVLHQPSYSNCITISTDTCAEELDKARTQFPLPQCESFPATADPLCEVNDTRNVTLNCSSSADCPNMCSEGFYCSSGFCRPRCDQWHQFSRATVVATDAVAIIAAGIGLICGIIVLVISCIRWKRMLVFPSIYIVYLTNTLILFALFVLISYVDRNGLYCSSSDLDSAMSNPTAFCILSAVMFYYVILQLAIWWFSHVLMMFWKIRFPYHARRFETAHYFKYVHITTVVLALIVPAIPIIAQFGVGGSKGAFGQIRYPPTLCYGLNRDIAFYGIALPIMILLQIGVTMLIIVFWFIHKQHGLFRARQSNSPFTVSTAERKILIVFCYYVVLGVFALISFTLTARNGPHFAQELADYFICEAQPDPDNPCSMDRYLKFSQPELTSIAIALFGLFPVANLIFAIDMREVKRVLGFFKGEFRLSGRDQPSASVASGSTTLSQ